MSAPPPQDPRAQPIRDLRALIPMHEADDAALTHLELLRKIDRKDRDEPR
jgi:hypothetical protein